MNSSGTSSQTPNRPTRSASSVSRYTWKGIVTYVMNDPKPETPAALNTSRKSRDVRSGARSITALMIAAIPPLCRTSFASRRSGRLGWLVGLLDHKLAGPLELREIGEGLGRRTGQRGGERAWWEER